MSDQPTRFYEFDSFCIDSVKRLLLRTGEPVPLPPKAFETLLALVQRSGRVLDKSELIDAVWPDTIVEENNLTQNISAIRKALGEQRGSHVFVVTVPGRGYSFVADVREVAANGSTNDDGHASVALEKIPLENDVDAEPVILNEAASNGSGPTQSRFWQLVQIGKRQAFAVVLFAIAVATLGSLWFLKDGRSNEVDGSLRSIAVLPFKPLQAKDADMLPIGAGMADALITKLSNVRQISVRPTGAVMRYTNRDSQPLTAGRELDVDAVLDGYVQRIDDRLRVTVQLIRTADGNTLWAATFDEQFTNIFSIQDSISEQAALALRVKLSGAELDQLQRRFTQNADAYQSFVKAHWFMNQATKEGIDKGIEYFQQAVARDPNYALAYAGLGDCYMRQGRFGGAPAQFLPQSRAAVMKSLEIDPTVSYAHSMAGRIAFDYDWDLATAKHEFQRARTLESEISHQWFAFYLLTIGKAEEGDVEIVRFERFQPTLFNVGFPLYLFYKREYDQALTQANIKLELNPQYPPIRNILGLIYEQKGMHREAIAEFEQAIRLSKGNVGMSSLGHLYAVMGRKDEARGELRKLVERSKHFYVSPLDMALVHAGLGEKNIAIAELEKAQAEHALGPALLRFDPRLDSLRAEPRFQELLLRIRL